MKQASKMGATRKDEMDEVMWAKGRKQELGEIEAAERIGEWTHCAFRGPPYSS